MPNHSEYMGARQEFQAPAAAGITETTGEFLPTVVTSTGTITLQALSICRWCVQGSLATFNIHLLVSSVASPTGSVSVRGFPANLTPFTGGNNPQGFMSCAVFGSGFTAGGSALQGEFFNGPPLSLTVTQISAGVATNIANLCQAGVNMEIMATYRVA